MLNLAAVGDLSNSTAAAAADDDGEFADFASFQATSLPQLTTQPHLLPKTETIGELTSAASYQPPVTSSLSISSNSPSMVSGKGASDKYMMIKELISNPSLFASGPSKAGTLTDDVDSEWSDFQEPSSDNVVQFGVQNTSEANSCPWAPPSDGEWADFQSTSASSHAVPAFHDVAPLSSLRDISTEEPSVRTKSYTGTNYSNAASWFGIQQNHQPSHALFSSGALDFCPPELPPEMDDDDDVNVGFYSVPGGDGGLGISSLSTLDLEDEPVDAVKNGGSFLKPGVCGMSTSNSTSSFEFTGWQKGSKHSLPVPAADSQSTSSLDLRPGTDPSSRSPNCSPSQPTAEADSQSESSFEFVPPSESRIPVSGILGADPDRMSLQSLELKSTIVSPEEEPTSGVGRDDVMQVTCQSLGGVDSGPANTGMPVCH